MLLDLGVNMEHFKDGARGFSIKADAPLDMRFSAQNERTAKDIVNGYNAAQLEKMLITYGDFSPKTSEYLTKGILEARKKRSIESTGQLTALLKALHFNQQKIAVVFQALRIETNRELEQLEVFLQTFGDWLSEGGRCGIITYHSIEDRMTKYALKKWEESGNFQLVNKKVIVPHYTEVAKNKAARSAKLRIIERKKKDPMRTEPLLEITNLDK
jgi:16S rRNA (cytosine1402-N4)-methyltransferase